MGVTIDDGRAFGTGGWPVSFGVTRSGSWVVGTLNASVAAALDVVESIPGLGTWLVRDGLNVAGTGNYSAPRTTIGVKRDGRLLSLEVDGCEPQSGCLFKLGKTEHEMADLLVARGALHAINLDGGGSSTAFADGKVINHPTDSAHWLLPSERAVTTIVCVL